MNTMTRNNGTVHTATRPRIGGGVRLKTLANVSGIILALALVVVACEHPVGLFASLEEEIPVDEERGVPTSTGMKEMVETNGLYYAAFGSLYVRDADETRDLGGSPGNDWSKIDRPAEADDGEPLGWIAEYDGNIYAVYDGNIYRRPAADGADGDWETVEKPNGNRASRLFSPAGVDELLVSIRVANGDTPEYELYYTDGDPDVSWNGPVDFEDNGDTFNTVSFIYSVVDFNGEVFIATNGNIFQADDPNNFDQGFNGQAGAIDDDTGFTAGSYRDLLPVDTDGSGTDDTLFVAAKGRVLSLDAPTGGTWSASSKKEDPDGSTVQFTALGWYTDDDIVGTAEGYLLAGTQQSGLYEARNGAVGNLEREGAGKTLLGREGNYLTTALSGNGVQRIFIDDDGNSWRSQNRPHIFVGAAGRGLWRGEFDEDTELNELYWRRE